MNAIEAVLGAAYLDGGLDAARRFVRAAWMDAMVAQALPPKDPKTALQEWLLGRGMPLPSYALESAEGPSHAPRFVIRVQASGKSGVGTAGSKRAVRAWDNCRFASRRSRSSARRSFSWPKWSARSTRR